MIVVGLVVSVNNASQPDGTHSPAWPFITMGIGFVAFITARFAD